ncbi:MAG: hypothetical protein WDW38_002517 [Sanguina aurantia]
MVLGCEHAPQPQWGWPDLAPEVCEHHQQHLLAQVGVALAKGFETLQEAAAAAAGGKKRGGGGGGHSFRWRQQQQRQQRQRQQQQQEQQRQQQQQRQRQQRGGDVGARLETEAAMAVRESW